MKADFFDWGDPSRMNNMPVFEVIPRVIKVHFLLFFAYHLTASALSFSHESLGANAIEKNNVRRRKTTSEKVQQTSTQETGSVC